MARDVQRGVPARLALHRPASMTLLQPSFRGRLRLFFAVIVVVPMIAVGVALFFLFARGTTRGSTPSSGRRRRSRRTCSSRRARTRWRRRRRCRPTSSSPRRSRTATGRACSSGWRRSCGRPAWSAWMRGSPSSASRSQIGSPLAIAASEAQLQDSDKRPIGRLVLSVTSARGVRGASAAADRGRHARRPQRRGAGVLLARPRRRSRSRTVRASTSRSRVATSARRASSPRSPAGRSTGSACSRRCRRTAGPRWCS